MSLRKRQNVLGLPPMFRSLQQISHSTQPLYIHPEEVTAPTYRGSTEMVRLFLYGPKRYTNNKKPCKNVPNVQIYI